MKMNAALFGQLEKQKRLESPPEENKEEEEPAMEEEVEPEPIEVKVPERPLPDGYE